MPACDLPSTSTLLDTEARISEENERYAVITIRIEKAAIAGFIARNGCFLSAVADLTPAIVPSTVKA